VSDEDFLPHFSASPTLLSGSALRTSSHGAVTLVDESTFCISDQAGDIIPDGPRGLFFQDMRILSRLELRVNGTPVEALATVSENPFNASFVTRAKPAERMADSTVLVFRSRYLGRGMREDIALRNYGREAAYASIEIFLDVDFADIFAVKEGRELRTDAQVTFEIQQAGSDANDENSQQFSPWASGEPRAPGETQRTPRPSLVYSYKRGGVGRKVLVSFGSGVHLEEGLASFEVVVPPKGEWSTCIEVSLSLEEHWIEPRYRCGQPVHRAAPTERLARWRRETPVVQSDYEVLQGVVERSIEDLGALRLFDPEYPERAVIAAGAPWFMTLFGRDSLLTAWMALIVDPDLALGVVQTLARFQGERVDPRNEEEPGRILHEMRFGAAQSLSLGGGSIYYGTVDATPLFVMLLGELRRWGLAREAVDKLMGNADRAIEWIEHFGDKDGDGYVEYKRASDHGLVNQGWKDSWDGIRFADGTLAEAPIALCEVQGYVYAAYVARAHFAHEAGDIEGRDRFAAKAAALKEAFNRDFWLEDKGWFALGLDARKKPIDSLASNMGHCLWTGIVDEERAEQVARRLASEEMFTGWGVRTLASSMGGYNPVSYHCGSVWPHDTAIVAAGLARYGFHREAQRLILGMLDAGAATGGRLPELFSGLERSEYPVPVDYPTSCSPQAWSAASSLLALRTLLRFDPWIPYGKVWVSPQLPEEIGYLRVEHIPLAGSRVTVEVDHGQVTVEGVPEGIELVTTPRKPLTAGWRV
jgi:glycogen debranching enzyme